MMATLAKAALQLFLLLIAAPLLSGFIRTLKALGLAWDVRMPPAEKLKFESRTAAA